MENTEWKGKGGIRPGKLNQDDSGILDVVNAVENVWRFLPIAFGSLMNQKMYFFMLILS